MSVGIVTGSSGLVGSESVRFLHEQGLDVVGLDNNMRAYFFGADGSTDWNARRLQEQLPRYSHVSVDIRDEGALDAIFAKYGADISIVIHCAAQPSHDWAAKEPVTDFTVNALATLYLLEATRAHCPDATFIYTSTNKVYGDTPNRLPLVETGTRWECSPEHAFAEHGIDETMSIDQCKHSVFGASKVAGDIMCQEYGRYFGVKTGIFRGGCLTGPAHSGAELHGFLAYLVKCQLTGRPYTIFGYKGKQVRDNIHSHDLVNAFWHFHQAPRAGEAYNMGGSRHSNCSVLEAVAMIGEMSGKELAFTLSEDARIGDHIWWISDVRKFQRHFPKWQYEYSIEDIVRQIVGATAEREGVTI
ncbi:MAG: NAD-dependent epimerase/dehydratase family protein [Lentisphaerae bacterium]|jgi:CDP-paratose 2-epimerase|nr:NAD-dependent epimerase/dehydratase family protein [Lentisphaerota bacterium]MBT5607045.1 NAD-dependent epimerase/dehydratase family protein [Lentisphaerota bacterium]MBT7055799.1 NAD-dependent epimerase/dehydratase family protein [Lentisphaerota bacterium]